MEKLVSVHDKTIALLIARGTFKKRYNYNGELRYKALLPLNGKPLVKYVLEALSKSSADKIFVVQGENEFLENIVPFNNKFILVTCKQNESSYASSVLFGIDSIINYYNSYKDEHYSNRNIIVVPCDVPLITENKFDYLVRNFMQTNADMVVPVINVEQLKKNGLNREFRSVYFNDLKGRYTLQNIAFFKTNIFDTVSARKNTIYNIDIAGNSGLLDRIALIADGLYLNREKPYVILQIIYNFLKGLAQRGRLLYSLKFLINLYGKKITKEQVRDAFSIILGINFEIIESREWELSCDVDLPDHLEWVARYLN